MRDGPHNRGGRARPVADAPVGALADEGAELARDWLLALLSEAPLAAAAAIPVADLAREGPALCAAAVRALGSDEELRRLAEGDLAPLAGTLAGARSPAETVAAVDALRAVLWRALLAELPRADPRLVSDLAERLSAVCATIAAAALGAPRAPVGEPALRRRPPGEEWEPATAAPDAPTPPAGGGGPRESWSDEAPAAPRAGGGPREPWSGGMPAAPPAGGGPGESWSRDPRVPPPAGEDAAHEPSRRDVPAEPAWEAAGPAAPSSRDTPSVGPVVPPRNGGDPARAARPPAPAQGALRAVEEAARGVLRAHDARPRIADGSPGAHLAERVAAHRAERRTLAVLVVELDGAARLAGTDGGPEALARAESAVEELLRPGDGAVREEAGRLWLSLPGTGPAGARAVALRVAAAVERTAEHRGTPLTASVGVAVFPVDADDPDDLAERAEEQLFAARAAGARGRHPGL